MGLLEVVITIDGKIVTDSFLLERFGLSLPVQKWEHKNLESLSELSVVIIPLIAGGYETFTLTGPPGEFLKIPVEFSLVSKKVKKKICYLRYQKKITRMGRVKEKDQKKEAKLSRTFLVQI